MVILTYKHPFIKTVCSNHCLPIFRAHPPRLQGGYTLSASRNSKQNLKGACNVEPN